MPRKIAGYGWIPDLPDQRDHVYAAPPPVVSALPPSADLRANCPPVYDQGQLGSCFPPGTRVRMADGSERPIEEVRLLEEVVTAEGRHGRVTSTMARDESGGLLTLTLWGHRHLRLTRDHPVLTARGYVAASDLQVGDEVAMPKFIASMTTSIVTDDLVSLPANATQRGKHWVGLPGRRGLSVQASPVPPKFELDAAFGRLIGLFLGEGGAEGGHARWHYGANEEETLVAETVRLLRAYGCDPQVRDKRPSHKSMTVTVYSTGWARLMSALCGNGSGGKRLHPALCAGPPEFLEAVLDGWLAGDGSLKRASTWEGVTISADLAMAMFDIAQALGRRPTIVHSESPQNRYARIRQPRWTVTISGNGAQNYSHQDARHVWRRVRGLSLDEYVGPVYNLSVEGDESYVAEGVGVHNCTANAIGGAIEFDQMKQKLSDTFVPSRLFIYYNERSIEGTVSADSGAQIRDGIKSVSAQGACHETLWPYDVSKFADKPPSKCYDEGAKNKAVTYQRLVRNPTQLKGCLASGYPFVFGFTVYEGFESQDVAKSGHAAMPASGEKVLGGHAVMAVGYDDASQWFVVRNSWGTTWGMAGYFTLPYGYLTQRGLSSDFWTIRLVS